MDRRLLAVVGLACLVALAGCTSVIGGAGDTPEGVATGTPLDGGATTPTPSETTSTETPTSSTPSETRNDATPAPELWKRPTPPNSPLERKFNESAENRILAVESDNGSANGSAGVTLSVTANTSMPHIDPASHGTVRGEPFFLVYVGGGLTDAGDWSGSQFHDANGTLAVREDPVVQRKNETFDLTVRPGAFEAANASAGEVELLVLLLDQDKQWDDIYGERRVTVEYEPTGVNATANRSSE